MKTIFNAVFLISTCCVVSATHAGVIILTKIDQLSETSIYQQGIAITLKNGEVNTIVDTNSNNCIAINHRTKRYLLIDCHLFNSVMQSVAAQKLARLTQDVPLAVQELMSANRPPRTPITIKRAGQGAYQGFRVEKFHFIVDEELVAEYWISSNLNKKIIKEINISKVNAILKLSKSKFIEGLNNKIDQKFLELNKNNLALKEFRYTGSKTRKISRQVTIRRVKIRKYLPPDNYTMYSNSKEYLSDSLKL